MNNENLENERLKLTITQLECKIELMKNETNNEIELYKNIINEKDNYIKLIENTVSLDYGNINKKLDYIMSFNEYKAIIDKAIEYIKSTKYEWGDLEEDNEDFDIDIYKLLDILKGSDSNE